MLGKILKFFSSDRSEEAEVPVHKMGMVEMDKLRHALAKHRIELKDSVLREVAASVRKREKITAIKLLREAAGVGLKEAKDAADALERLL